MCCLQNRPCVSINVNKLFMEIFLLQQSERTLCLRRDLLVLNCGFCLCSISCGPVELFPEQ